MQGPELVGEVAGYRFYEHPIRGDEAPLVMITPDGRMVKRTDFWDLPTTEELAGL
ncbi:MAG: hypothetical protein ACRDBG_23560 [Waterburya sp.]